MVRWLVVVAVATMAIPLALVLLVSQAPATSRTTGGPSALALADIPSQYLTLYLAAARTCPGLPWGVLAGIGTVESDAGESNLPGVHSGANHAGAEGGLATRSAHASSRVGRGHPPTIDLADKSCHNLREPIAEGR